MWKQDLKVTYYIKLNLSRQQRSFLAQLRSGSLPIHIETGRYIGLTVDKRICKFCTSGSVETEYHFLFECSCYEETRNYFFRVNGIELLDLGHDDLAIKLFTDAPRALARFTSNLYNLRREKEYPTL